MTVTANPPSAKALGKRRMVETVDAPVPSQIEAARFANLVCAAPAADSPPAARPPADTRGDEALAAMLQAEADEEVRHMVLKQKAEEEDAAYAELYGDSDCLEDDIGQLNIEQAQVRCARYKLETDLINKMLSDLEAGKAVDAAPSGYTNTAGCGFSDDEVDPVEITAAYLDTNDDAGLLPLTHARPSPEKPSRKKRVIAKSSAAQKVVWERRRVAKENA